MSNEKYPWPQWQLSAFVLNELEPDIAAQIQSAAASDPSLAAEIAAIRETVAQVTQLYKHETTGIEPTVLSSTLMASNSDPVVFTKNSTGKVNWTAVAGLLAMAASLLVAFILGAPALNTYFSQSKDVLANADIAKRIETAEARNRELTREIEKAKEALSQQTAIRKSLTEVAPSTSEQLESLVVTEVAPSTPEQIESLMGTYNDLTSQKRYAEAEVIAKKVGELAGGGRRSLAASNSIQSGKKTKEEAFADALANVDQPSDPTHSSLAVAPVISSPTSSQSSSATKPAAPMSIVNNLGSAPLLPSSTSRAKESKENSASASPAGGMGMGGEGGEGGVEMRGSMRGGMMGGMKGDMEGIGYGGTTLSTPAILSDEVQYFSEAAPQSAGEPQNQKSLGSAVPAFRDFGVAAGAGLGQEDRLADDSKLSTSLSKRGRDRYPMPGEGSDRYAPIYENPFKSVTSDPLTTFSIDVDTASYVKARQFILQSHSLPPANAVRVEEFINYFEYEYAGPKGDDPFSANLAVATCPWRADHKLVRIALQAKKMDVSERPKANIVFLLDVSGSMDEPNKLPLVKESMRMLIQQLSENDRVAMVVYAGAAGCVLESTTGDKQDVILGALDRLNAGGSTNGGQGIQLAYDIARDHFVPGGVNRVILCTDGDFNVGTTSTEGLVNLVVENAKSKVFLTVLGFGMGNTNDAMMEQISDKGNGVYGFVDSRREAQRQMIKQLAGNLMTVAKDVKIQVEFNPERVASYRLIGYENRKLANEDFANDKKDAGEIGAGHRVTALYEIEPIGPSKVQPAEGLRYQKRKTEVTAEPVANPNDESSNELLAVSLRYKQPEGDTSKLLTFPLTDSDKPFTQVDQDFKWAASVAQFAMLLRNSTHKGNSSWSGLLETAESLATDESRRECVDMMRAAASLSGR